MALAATNRISEMRLAGLSRLFAQSEGVTSDNITRKILKTDYVHDDEKPFQDLRP